MTARIRTMLTDGYLERCDTCDGLGCYSYCDVSEGEGIRYIPRSQFGEWECPHCGTYWRDTASLILESPYAQALEGVWS